MEDLQIIQNKIYEIRGQRVMLDFDLAEMYQVKTSTLNQSIKRNTKRFPLDFMFRLTNQEFTSLISQIVTSNRGGTRKLPYAFTEQGVAMLSGLLNSDIAINVNIGIMRAFVQARTVLAQSGQVTAELAELRSRMQLMERDTQDNLEAMNDLSEDQRHERSAIIGCYRGKIQPLAYASRKPCRRMDISQKTLGNTAEICSG